MRKIVYVFFAFLLLVSCKDKVDNEQAHNKYVNNWIHDNMSALYYWNKELPARKTSYDDPDIYFKTLIYRDDRFSAIFDNYTEILNSLHGVSDADPGFEYQLYLESEANNNVIGAILYNKPRTNASVMGAVRGRYFRKINGVQLTTDNYRNVIGSFSDVSSTFTLTFGLHDNGAWVDDNTVTITKAKNYKESPIYLDTVYQLAGKKIGYLVYNFFTNDNGDGTSDYDLALNSVFGRFKQENISELIVDFRYNSGGMVSTAVRMSSMMVPNLTDDKVCIYTEYNDNYTKYFKSAEYKNKYKDNPFVDNFATKISVTKPVKQDLPINNVGNQLQRVFFLTGKRTASASEMVINGLKPYIPCVLIGDVTVGKNVGSTLVNDTKNKNNDWAILPIILKYFNKNHESDFTMGFTPDFSTPDTYNYALGNLSETLLHKAVEQIVGSASFAPPVKSTGVSLGKPVEFRDFGRLVVDKPEINELIQP